MIRRGTVSSPRQLKLRERRRLLRVLETAMSIAVTMTPFSLVAFQTISGA
jgi:hypothetical protein